MTAELRNGQPKSPFSEWVRNCRDLDSRTANISIVDGDWIIHQFATRPNGRYVQNLMYVEEKTRRSDVTKPQRDTLYTFEQILGRIKRKDGNTKLPVSFKTWSTKIETWVNTRFWGFHKLRFSHAGPMDSGAAHDGWIEWDRKRIGLNDLIDLVRFHKSPYTLKPRDERLHHGGEKQIAMAFPCREDWGSR